MNKRSKLGYKRYSPDVNNPYNIIPSGRITMKDVDFPVYGVDEYGNSQMMYPGAEYQFPGNQVFEIPMAQRGMSTRRVNHILNDNRNLNWVQRLYEPNTPSIQIPGLDGPSTHYMESADSRVYPTVVQMPDGNLQYLGDRAYDYADETGEYIQFKNDRQARRFAKNYKKGTGVLKGFQSGGKLLYHPGSDTYYGPELEEAVVIGEKSKDYPYADQLDERSRQYWRENYSDKNNAIVRGIKTRARIGDKKGLYGELESLAKDVLNTAAEYSGLAGATRFIDDPVSNLKGAGKTVENFLLGTNPMASSFINTEITPEQSGQFFNTLDVVGMASAAGPMVKAVAKPISNLITPITRAGKLNKLPTYINDIPLSPNSDILVTQAIPGTVESIKGTVKGTPILTARGSNNNYVNFKKFLDPATNEQYYSFTESFVDNPLAAGRIFKMAEDMVPRGSILKQPPSGTLSQDSFNLMTRRLGDTKRFRDLTNYDADYINLNEFAKGRNRLGQDGFTFSKSDLDALNAQYMDVFNNLGISEFRGLGSREVPVLPSGTEYNPFQINSIRSIKDPRASQKYYNVSVPNITLQKLYKKGGLVKAQFGIQTAAFMPMMAQAYGAVSSWFNDDSKPATTTPAAPENVDWRTLSRPKQIDYAIGELTAFEKEENRKALENLLESTAYMENRYGEDPRAYGRDYTSSFMSIDPIALKDMFTGRGANGAYNSAQRRQFETFKQLDLPTDQKQFDALLREDNPVAAMAAARYRYALVPQALPSANDQQGMFDYWLKYYNGSGILKHKTRAEAYKDFQRAYQRALSND